MQLDRFQEITGRITCLTGLRVGGTQETAGIGESDNPVIRHPVTKIPYIPGSSLKGKLRSLLEIRHSSSSQRSGKPCDCGKCVICKLFGCGDVKNLVEPGRLIFRDATMTDETREKLETTLPGSLVEVKSEIQMDRIKGSTSRGSLRQLERVPEGAEFQLVLSMRLFKEDDANRRREFLNMLAEGFELLEKDYLGGCGSRGYGQVKMTHEGKPMSEYLRGLPV